jgi:hypothetical protein
MRDCELCGHIGLKYEEGWAIFKQDGKNFLGDSVFDSMVNSLVTISHREIRFCPDCGRELK